MENERVMNAEMKNPSMVTWVRWLGATMLASLTLTAFAYTNFETKDEAKEKKQDIVKSLLQEHLWMPMEMVPFGAQDINEA
jgi:hypothetical protein